MRSRALRVLALLFALSLLGAAFTACGEDEPVEDEVTDVGDAGADVDDDSVDEADSFFADPRAFVGEEVEVAVIVDRVVDQNGFVTSSEDGSGEPFLVVHDSDELMSREEVVEVTGTVYEFDLVQLEDALGVDLDDVAFETFDGEYAIVADSVDPAEAGA